MIDKNELVHRIVRGLGDAAFRIAINPGRVGIGIPPPVPPGRLHAVRTT